MATKTIPAGEFKAKCLALMDEIAVSGDELLITKRGKAVARLVPARESDPYLSLRGSVTWKDEEDLIAPTGEPWPGESDDTDYGLVGLKPD